MSKKKSPKLLFVEVSIARYCTAIKQLFCC